MHFTAPKTVAQAIAPFEKVKANLKSALAEQATHRRDAQSRLAAARKASERAETTETANIKAAQNEELQAKALIEKLDALLSPAPVDLDTMSPAEKANAGKKLD